MSNIDDMDLTLRLLEAGQAKLKADEHGVRLQVKTNLTGALLGETLKHRINANLTAHGVGPRNRVPAPVVVPAAVIPIEETHQVAECPECSQGKHRNCDGSAWCVTHDALELCPCAQNDHQ